MKKDRSVNGLNLAVLPVLIIASLLIVSVCAAMQAEIPRISIQELKKMMDQGVKVTIIDVQPKAIYDKGHIKGAVSIPWKSQISLEDVWSLASDKPIVTYCACGPGESDSADVANQLIRMGYDDVKVLKDPSIQGWKEAGYPIEKK
ncbi:MAG: rhodanese-like domain-containing protein [Deltaproteobacteria bacterium]|nr:rhodanese-like domain-containing protein [Deltaproteobacteria bacterium]